MIRLRLTAEATGLSEDIAGLRKAGFTDWVVYPLKFMGGSVHAVAFSTKAQGGFTEAHLAALAHVVRPLSRVGETLALMRTAVNLLNAYVGNDAGERILKGQIQRGDTETIRCVIWFSDLRGFTAMSGERTPREIIAILNEFFECQVPAIEHEGGQVLKFIGDGLLAMFPVDAAHDAKSAGEGSVRATAAAFAALEKLNQVRQVRGEAKLAFGVALHLGEVAYGNIGGASRLDFTAIGPAVNLASRIEGMTGKLGKPVLLSAQLARELSMPTRSVGAHRAQGHHRARGAVRADLKRPGNKAQRNPGPGATHGSARFPLLEGGPPMSRLWLTVVALVLGGCQVAEFQRVTPMTVAQTPQKTIVANRQLKPNVMLVLDTSGSMLLPVDATAPSCAPGCGTASAPCAAGCATRIFEVKTSIDGFLASSVANARVGLTTFPADSLCSAPTSQRIELPPPSRDDASQAALLEARAQEARALVQAVQPMGGTPTAATLRFVGELPGLQDASDFRDDFALLLTDGLPNCNDAHPAQLCGGSPTPAQEQACACTVSSCASSLCSRGCLDADATLEAVRALRAKNIRTIVLGFGAEVVTGDAPRVLAELAHAGGMERTCGAVPCDVPFYRAGNATELAEALQRVLIAIDSDPCQYWLAARPSSPETLSVLVDGVDVRPGADTWNYDVAGNKVFFTGPLCAQLEASTTLMPVSLEFRIVEVL